MKTLLVYESTHGCTGKCAVRLHGLLEVKPEIIRLRRTGRINVNNYNTVIIGGSIHAGTMQSRVRNFITSNLEKLIKKRVGLFVCCMEEGEKAEEQFKNAFPEELRKRAVAKGIFGGEFDFDRMNFFQKTIVRKVKGVNESVSKIVDDEIVRFAESINSSHRFRKKA